MESDVSRLLVVEKAGIHGEALSVLHWGLGSENSEDAIERAVVEVATQMGAVEQALHLGDVDGMGRAAGSLIDIGEQLGFLLLTRVAADVMTAARRQDMPALHAVVGRLIRVGDSSLAEVIDAATLPG